MEIELYPHQILEFDYRQLSDEADRQEKLFEVNRGEKQLAQDILDFFTNYVRNQIESNEWVFEGSKLFAESFIGQYFHVLRLSGHKAVNVQAELHETNNEVLDLIADLAKQGLISETEDLELAKASEFTRLVLFDKVDGTMRDKIKLLHEKVSKHEELQLNLTLKLIREMYEIALPRVMFVVKRALKIDLGRKPQPSDERLLSPSNYIDWFSTSVDHNNPIYDLLAGSKNREFYKTARNVASHHLGLIWESGTNTVILEDKNQSLKIHVHEFQKRYRYLQYFCDYGTRGILASYFKKERGNISNRVCKDYEATFPPNLPDLAPRKIKLY